MDIVGGWTFSFKRKIIRFLWQKCLLYSELCDYSYFHFFQNEAICVCSGCFLALWDNKQGTFPYVEERHFHLNAHHEQLDLSRWSSSSQPSLSSSSLPHCHHRGMQSHPVIFILIRLLHRDCLCCLFYSFVAVLIFFVAVLISRGRFDVSIYRFIVVIKKGLSPFGGHYCHCPKNM